VREKKILWHSTFGEISVEERQYRHGSQSIRPFVERAKVRHRRCSQPLQRVVTDFAADVAFAQVEDKLVEHYGIFLDESTIRRITLLHAQAILEATPVDDTWPTAAGCQTVIVEMDGGMVPIVEPDTTQTDRRKGKTLVWKEAKLCLAHEAGSQTLSYGGTLQGDVDEAGKQLFACAKHAGFGKTSQVHAVGDGAEWIARQVDERFGSRGGYLVDFYHVCDYLSAAATAIHSEANAAKVWLEQQKAALKAGQHAEVIESLSPYLESSAIPDHQAPVRSCHRYLSRRQNQLDYPSALANDLPIGSGEIESAHRYIVQKRLKLPGAWWRAANADHMLALRLNRANRQWDSYWKQARKAA
jgi:hypothetical protein